MQKNENNPPRFRPTHTFQYFSCKLLIIKAITSLFHQYRMSRLVNGSQQETGEQEEVKKGKKRKGKKEK